MHILHRINIKSKRSSMSFSLDNITTGVSDFVKNTASKVGNVLDPSNARLSIAGLLKGGRKKAAKNPDPRVGVFLGDPNGQRVAVDKDWKVRISLSPNSKLFYQSPDAGILAPLLDTMGVIFPYTPSITITSTATYNSTKNTHSNYPSYFYDNSEVQTINVSGDFTVQGHKDGQYLLACIYFLRSCTKMFYGQSANAGNPPPIVFLNGYGDYLLPNVPCIITSFQHVMNSDIDYIEVPVTVKDPAYVGMDPALAYGETGEGRGRIVRLPTASQIQLSLQPVYSRNRVGEFDLEKFAAGDLINKGFV